MEKITIFARMSVEPDSVAEIEALAQRACQAVADQPGTLVYDWHYSDEYGTLIVLETYTDSAAHIAHMQAEGHEEMMGSLMALIGSIEFYVLGEPTAEHAETLSAVPGAQFYSELASK
jgi:quinol monooxygenase YgiN